jgi:hypothetical protein
MVPQIHVDDTTLTEEPDRHDILPIDTILTHNESWSSWFTKDRFTNGVTFTGHRENPIDVLNWHMQSHLLGTGATNF